MGWVGLSMADAKHGVALFRTCDGHACVVRALSTSDGGDSWIRRGVIPLPGTYAFRRSPPYDAITGVLDLGDQRMVAYGQGLWASSNGARTWHRTSVSGRVVGASLADGRLWAVEIACGLRSGCRLKADVVASDGHITSVVSLNQPTASWVGHLQRTDAAVFLPSGGWHGDSWLMVSHDDGRTWDRLHSPAAGCWGPGGDGNVVSAGRGGLVTICSDEPGVGNQDKATFRSTDGGRHWTRLGTPERYGYATQLLAASALWRFGGRAPVYRSVDGGRHWAAMLTDVVGDAAGPQVNVIAAVGRNAWVGPGTEDDPIPRLFVTHDDGEHWSRVRVS
jgi:photosystem II stability/assembly factor-like uncharacterized protein